MIITHLDVLHTSKKKGGGRQKKFKKDFLLRKGIFGANSLGPSSYYHLYYLFIFVILFHNERWQALQLLPPFFVQRQLVFVSARADGMVPSVVNSTICLTHTHAGPSG